MEITAVTGKQGGEGPSSCEMCLHRVLQSSGAFARGNSYITYLLGESDPLVGTSREERNQGYSGPEELMSSQREEPIYT